MSSTQTPPLAGPSDPGPRPGLMGCLDQMQALLDDTAEVDPLFLSTAQKQEYLLGLERLQRRLSARAAHALAVSGDVGVETGARSAGAWVAHEVKGRAGRLRHVERLGARLRDSYGLTAAAWAAGELSEEHATAIADSIDALPAHIPGIDTAEARAELMAQAEAVLVRYSREFTARQVRRLGRRILEVAAPDVADAVEQELLEKEERKARRRIFLSLTRAGEGTTKVRGEIPDAVADLLRAALNAYTNPRRPDGGSNGPGSRDARSAHSSTTGGSASTAGGSGDPMGEGLSPSERAGQAFCSLLEHLPTHGLPTHGGTPVSVIVTIGYQQLVDGVGAGTLDTGERLSATAVRRLACAHGVIPAVLGGAGEVLDLGRRSRFFRVAQRLAHAIHHPTCQARGCEMPASMCESHHRRAWSAGGRTDLKDLAFLCGFHHHRAHDPAYEAAWNEADEVTFHRRRP